MNYKVTDKTAEVTITTKDVDKNVTEKNVYNYMPKEVQDFYYKHKDKKNFKETKINGRTTPYKAGDNNCDAIFYYFELL